MNEVHVTLSSLNHYFLWWIWETTYPINLDNKNYVDFVATVDAWGVTNHVYIYQIMSKE